jgi:hypothetical protein
LWPIESNKLWLPGEEREVPRLARLSSVRAPTPERTACPELRIFAPLNCGSSLQLAQPERSTLREPLVCDRPLRLSAREVRLDGPRRRDDASKVGPGAGRWCLRHYRQPHECNSCCAHPSSSLHRNLSAPSLNVKSPG